MKLWFDDYFEVVFDPSKAAWAWLSLRPGAAATAEPLRYLQAIGQKVLPVIGASLLDVETFYRTEFSHAANIATFFLWNNKLDCMVSQFVVDGRALVHKAPAIQEEKTDPDIVVHHTAPAPVVSQQQRVAAKLKRPPRCYNCLTDRQLCRPDPCHFPV
jgi:hypothetical protein